MKKQNNGNLIALLGMALLAAILTMGNTSQPEDSLSQNRLLIAELEKTNAILLKMNETLVELDNRKELEESNELLETMNAYLESIDEKVDGEHELVKQINSNINNSRNPICILEQLEDIKTALQNMN